MSSHLTTYANNGFGRHGNVEHGDERVSKSVKSQVILSFNGFLYVSHELDRFRNSLHPWTGNAERAVGTNPGRAIGKAHRTIH